MFKIHLINSYDIFGDGKQEDDITLNLGLGGEYYIIDNLSLNASFIVKTNEYDNDFL